MDGRSSFRLYLFGHGRNLCGGNGLCRGRASALVQGHLPRFAAALGYHLRPFRCVHREPVWTDTEKAKAEIDREASALRTVVILATTFPKDSEAQLPGLIP